MGPRDFRNLIYFHEADRGGHFAAFKSLRWRGVKEYAQKSTSGFYLTRKEGNYGEPLVIRIRLANSVSAA